MKSLFLALAITLGLGQSALAQSDVFLPLGSCWNVDSDVKNIVDIYVVEDFDSLEKEGQLLDGVLVGTAVYLDTNERELGIAGLINIQYSRDTETVTVTSKDPNNPMTMTIPFGREVDVTDEDGVTMTCLLGLDPY